MPRADTVSPNLEDLVKIIRTVNHLRIRTGSHRHPRVHRAVSEDLQHQQAHQGVLEEAVSEARRRDRQERRDPREVLAEGLERNHRPLLRTIPMVDTAPSPSPRAPGLATLMVSRNRLLIILMVSRNRPCRTQDMDSRDTDNHQPIIRVDTVLSAGKQQHLSLNNSKITPLHPRCRRGSQPCSRKCRHRSFRI